MNTDPKGLWHYFEKWQSVFQGGEPLSWEGSRLANSWCSDCRFCCGEQDNCEPFPMALLPEQIGPDTAADFYMINKNTAGLGAEGCKSCGPQGCRLPVEKRPVACGFFPIVLAKGGLYLYQICPAAMFIPLDYFYRLAREVALYLEKFSLAELKHISISLSDEVIMDKYINLHVRLFDDRGKETVFE